MASVPDWLEDAVDNVDAGAMPWLVRRVSVSASAVRQELRTRGWAFIDPDAEPIRVEIADRTADRVIDQAQTNAATIGAVTGVGGWLTLPPEMLGWAVSVVRLSQRLTIVYGLDPVTSRGRLAATRALAAGLELNLPDVAISDLRVRDVVGAIRPGAPDGRSLGATLLRGVLASAARVATGRVGRLLPLVASGVAAADNHRLLGPVGKRMKAALRRHVDLPALAQGRIIDVVEVVPD